MKNNFINNINKIRREYTQNKLSRNNLTSEPIQLFQLWLKQACQAKIPDPTAMCLATIDNFGYPHQRFVLLKNFNKNEIIFYTNLNSNKSIHIQHNPKVSICFPWHMLDRQVIILGYAHKLSKIEVEKYFHSRPKYSQITAWISPQSKKIKSKAILNKEFLKLTKQFSNIPVPVPSFWGGYRIYLTSIEFWQGRKHRLHDRFIYKKQKGKWYISRLAP